MLENSSFSIVHTLSASQNIRGSSSFIDIEKFNTCPVLVKNRNLKPIFEWSICLGLL